MAKRSREVGAQARAAGNQPDLADVLAARNHEPMVSAMLPATTDRVSDHSPERYNREIRERFEASLRYHARHPERIGQRLDELDHEWDIERMLETNAAAFTLAGLALAMTVDRRWLALPVGVAAFLLQHAMQGWCPPMPVFRAFGFRTASEIEAERYALKALRGDFQPVTATGDPARAAQQAVAA